MLDELLRHFEDTAAEVIARAIDRLHGEVCRGGLAGGDERTPAGLVEAGPAAEAGMPAAAGMPVGVVESRDAELLLNELERALQGGTALHDVRELLIALIKAWHEQQVSSKEIAERLNRAEIPTLSGRGEWQSGMIPTILILSY